MVPAGAVDGETQEPAAETAARRSAADEQAGHLAGKELGIADGNTTAFGEPDRVVVDRTAIILRGAAFEPSADLVRAVMACTERRDRIDMDVENGRRVGRNCAAKLEGGAR